MLDWDCVVADAIALRATSMRQGLHSEATADSRSAYEDVVHVGRGVVDTPF